MKKMNFYSILLPAVAFALTACGNSSQKSDKGNTDLANQLKGTWVAPVNGMPSQMEGFELKNEGVASSVNMATLVYEKWETARIDNTDALILQGKSIGNGQTIEFTDTLKIDKLTDTSLTVTDRDYTRTYEKKK